MIRRLFMTVLLLCLGLLLGSCSSFSGLVADHWPHWAGGMPDDIPPRPGAPGYDEFIAHKQMNKDAAQQPTGSVEPVSSVEKANDRAAPAANHAPNDPAAVQGGLY